MIGGQGTTCAPVGLAPWGLALLMASGCASTAAHRRPPCPDHMFVSSAGACVPKAWYCSPALYNAGPEDGCDCNCGAPDPDCGKNATSFWCYGMGMARQVSQCALCDADKAPASR